MVETEERLQIESRPGPLGNPIEIWQMLTKKAVSKRDQEMKTTSPSRRSTLNANRRLSKGGRY